MRVVPRAHRSSACLYRVNLISRQFPEDIGQQRWSRTPNAVAIGGAKKSCSEHGIARIALALNVHNASGSHQHRHSRTPRFPVSVPRVFCRNLKRRSHMPRMKSRAALVSFVAMLVACGETPTAPKVVPDEALLAPGQ